MDFENKLALGNGIYTMPDIAQILRIPNYKVNRWVKKYWDGRFGKAYEEKYSWTIDLTKAISFHSLVELYTFYHLSEAGVKTQKILVAHQELADEFSTPFPFAKAKILDCLSTDGLDIYFRSEDFIYTVDGTKQLNLEFIKLFFKKLDFDDDSLASRLWPLGKDKSIVCDPKRQFGQPIVSGTNIFPETLAGLFQAGDSIACIASLYELEEKKVEDAIEYISKAA